MTSAPRIGLYQCANYLGAPFVLPDGSLDVQVVADTARFGTVVLEAYVILQRPEIAAALRAANPALRLIAFMDLEKVHATPHTMDAATDLRYEYYAALAANNGILWSAKDGEPFDPLNLPGARKPWSQFAANLASPAAVRAISDVLVRRVHGSGLFGGICLDWAAHSIIEASSPWKTSGDSIDFVRAGFDGVAARAAFDAAYRQGHRDFVRAMMDAAPSDSWIVNFNCGDDDPIEYAWESGQMLEDPAFDADPLAAIRAVRYRETRCRRPGLNWLNTRPQGGATWDEHDPSIGFALAGAYMTETGVATVSENGRPEPDGREKRWSPLYNLELGDALTPALADGPSRLVRYFEGGIVRLDAVAKLGRFWTTREVQP